MISYSIFLFLSLFILAINASSNLGLLVIPGLGRTDRVKTVLSNILSLHGHLSVMNDGNRKHDIKAIKWDCLIYIYAPRTDKTFWENNKQDLDHINHFCQFIEYPNKKVTENLFMLQPLLIENKYSYIFILLDDCKLISKTDELFPLDKILRIMNNNKLTVASPLVNIQILLY